MYLALDEVWKDERGGKRIDRTCRMRDETEFSNAQVLTYGEHIVRPAQRSAPVPGWIWFTTTDARSIDRDEAQSQRRGQLIIESRHISRQAHSNTNEHCSAIAIANLREADNASRQGMLDPPTQPCVLKILRHRHFDTISSRQRRGLLIHIGMPRMSSIARRLTSILPLVVIQREVWMRASLALRSARRCYYVRWVGLRRYEVYLGAWVPLG